MAGFGHPRLAINRATLARAFAAIALATCGSACSATVEVYNIFNHGSRYSFDVALSGLPSDFYEVRAELNNENAYPAPQFNGTGATLTIWFPLSVAPVGADVPVKLNVFFWNDQNQWEEYTAASFQRTVRVPGANTLASVTTASPDVIGGASLSGTVTLAGQATTLGARIAMSDNSTAVNPVGAVVIGQGASSGGYTVTTNIVQEDEQVTLTASAAGVQKHCSLTVRAVRKVTDVHLSQATAYGPTSIAGTVYINLPAYGSGSVVALSSSNPAVASVPSSVIVVAGATTAAFPITVSQVGAAADVTITATLNGARSEVLRVEPLLAEVSLAPSMLCGGMQSTGTVRLNAPAPGGGLYVALSCDHPSAATVPNGTVVHEGSTSASFAVTALDVAQHIQVQIDAWDGKAGRSAILTVKPWLRDVVLSPATVCGTVGGKVTVRLNAPSPTGGIRVLLNSSRPEVASIPPHVDVPAGTSEADIWVTPVLVQAPTPVTLGATYGVSSASAVLTVIPLVADISVSPNPTAGTIPTSLAVSLNCPAPAGGSRINVSSDRPDIVGLPASIEVPPGASTASCPVSIQLVGTSTRVVLHATDGAAIRETPLDVIPLLSGISVAPNPVHGGKTASCALSISMAAPPGGTRLFLTSSAPDLFDVPPSVSVPEGSKGTSFAVRAGQVPDDLSVTLTATDGAATKQVAVVVLTPRLAGFVIDPETVLGGAVATCTLTLDCPALPGGATIFLDSDRPDVLAMPGTIAIPSQQEQVTFPVTPAVTVAPVRVRLAARFRDRTIATSALVAPEYALDVIGTLGGPGSKAFALNDASEVVGIAQNEAGDPRAFRYQGGAIADIGPPGVLYAAGHAVASDGAAVGAADHPSGALRAFRWLSGTAAYIGTLGGRDSVAYGVNSAGQIVGASQTAIGDVHAFVWQDGVLTDLNLPGLGGRTSAAHAINQQGQIVGEATTAAGDIHAFRYEAGSMTDLGTLGGRQSSGRAINASGDVVGSSNTVGGDTHAFLHQLGHMMDLGTVGGRNSIAYGINDAGLVVGRSANLVGDQVAFLWGEGAMVDLNRTIRDHEWRLVDACAINAGSQIAGWGYVNTDARGFLLTPVRKARTRLTVDSHAATSGMHVILSATLTHAVTGDPLPGLHVEFTIGEWTQAAVTDANGRAYLHYDVPEMPAGEYPICCVFRSTIELAAASGVGALRIGAVSTSLWTIDRTGTITETVNLRQYDLSRTSDNALLEGKTINYRIDGTQVGTAVTNAGGDSNLAWVITDGPATRTITVEFAGDGAYMPCTAGATLTAQRWTTKMATFDRMQRITGTTELKARLVRSDSVPLYNRLIDFSVDGTFVISRPTNTTGYASYPYYTVPDAAGAGTRTILSSFTGNAGYASCSKTATLTVLKAPPYIWVHPRSVPQGGIARLYAYFRRLKDYQPQTGKPVVFRVDGTFVANIVTDGAGIARYNFDTTGLSVGVHTIRCEFAGDGWVDAGYGEANLTIY